MIMRPPNASMTTCKTSATRNQALRSGCLSGYQEAHPLRPPRMSGTSLSTIGTTAARTASRPSKSGSASPRATITQPPPRHAAFTIRWPLMRSVPLPSTVTGSLVGTSPSCCQATIAFSTWQRCASFPPPTCHQPRHLRPRRFLIHPAWHRLPRYPRPSRRRPRRHHHLQLRPSHRRRRRRRRHHPRRGFARTCTTNVPTSTTSTAMTAEPERSSPIALTALTAMTAALDRTGRRLGRPIYPAWRRRIHPACRRYPRPSRRRPRRHHHLPLRPSHRRPSRRHPRRHHHLHPRPSHRRRRRRRCQGRLPPSRPRSHRRPTSLR